MNRVGLVLAVVVALAKSVVPVPAISLGTWQRIFYAEFDGQRDKRVIVKVMGE